MVTKADHSLTVLWVSGRLRLVSTSGWRSRSPLLVSSPTLTGGALPSRLATENRKMGLVSELPAVYLQTRSSVSSDSPPDVDQSDHKVRQTDQSEVRQWANER